MTVERRARRFHKREDGTFEVAGAVATVGREGGSMHDRLHSLQRSYGNQAVTALVQRRGHHGGGAASTSVSKPAPAKQADFFPKDHVSKSLEVRDVGWLEYVAPLELKNGSPARAAKFYEELVYKQQRDRNAVKRWAIALHMAYRSIAPDRSLYWKQVAMGQIVPQETKTDAELMKEMDAAETASQSF